MKQSTIFVISFFIVSLIASMALGSYYIYLERESLIHQAHEHLEDVAHLKMELVEGFLEAKKARAVDFASDGFIKNSLLKLKQEGDYEEVSEELEHHLTVNKMPVEEAIYEIYVLDADGNEVAETVHEEFEEEHEEAEGKGSFYNDSLYLEGKNRAYAKGVFYDYEFGGIGVAFSAPILLDGKFLGVVIIKLTTRQLAEITIERTGFEETEEVYIINREGYMVTPSRFLKGESKGVLVQIVDTENSRNCFEGIELYDPHLGKLKEHEEKTLASFKDYRGENVLGIHKHFLEIESCILVEIDEKEVLDSIKDFIKKQIIVSLIVIFILTVIGYFVGRYFDGKIKRNKIKRFPCGTFGKFRPWYCILVGGKCNTYPNGRCGKVIKTRKFLINLKLSHSILIALIFIIGYFFLVTSFFQGWQNAAFYDEISDLSAVFVLILLFFLGIKLKKSAGFLISFGSLLAIFDKLVQIILEEYIFAFGFISSFYWIPGEIIGFIGLFLIFFGFKEVLK